jgi:hypothetical protein
VVTVADAVDPMCGVVRSSVGISPGDQLTACAAPRTIRLVVLTTLVRGAWQVCDSVGGGDDEVVVDP